MNTVEKSRRLRELILAKETLVMPDAYDPISARIIESLGFPAVQCSGGSMSMAAMPYNLRTLSLKALKEAGVARVSLPVVAIFSAVRALTDAIRSIRDTQDFGELLEKDRLCRMEDIGALLKRS